MPNTPSSNRQLQAELRRRLRRAQALQTGFNPRALRLAGVYEDVAAAALFKDQAEKLTKPAA